MLIEEEMVKNLSNLFKQFMWDIWWLYVNTSRSYSWGHFQSGISYEQGSDYYQVWRYGHLKCSMHKQSW